MSRNKTSGPCTLPSRVQGDSVCILRPVTSNTKWRLNRTLRQTLLALLMPFLKTAVRNNVFCARFYYALLTTCFGPDQWPSSGNTYIKYTKAPTVYVNGSVEIAA
jgi:hypothetical protein